MISMSTPACLAVLEYSLSETHRFCSLQATVPNDSRRLKHGIGNYHEAPDEQDKRIIQRLFESGAIRLRLRRRRRLGACRWQVTW